MEGGGIHFDGRTNANTTKYCLGSNHLGENRHMECNDKAVNGDCLRRGKQQFDYQGSLELRDSFFMVNFLDLF